MGSPKKPPSRAAKRAESDLVSSPHDRVFAFTFGQKVHAIGLLRATLPPALADRLDWSTLSRQPADFVDVRLRRRQSDLLFSIRTVDTGEEVLVYVLLEHQRAPDARMAYRVLRYVVRIWEDQETGRRRRARGASPPDAPSSPPGDSGPPPEREPEQDPRLPLIYPLVVYHGKAPWSAPCEVFDLVHVPHGLAELVAAHVPRLRFQLLDLAADDPEMDRRMEEALTTFGRVVLWAMEVADEDERMQQELPRMLRLLNEVVARRDAQAAFGALLRYLLASHERIDRERLRRTIEETIAPTAGEFVVTEYDRLVEQGRRKGLRQGLERGRVEGRAEGRVEGRVEGGVMVLLAQIEAKLGPVTDDVRTRVNAATPAELTAWATRILTAATLADVFDAPAAAPAAARPPSPPAARKSPSTARRSTRPRR